VKLVVADVHYDITESLQGATLGDLMNLKLKTRRPDDGFIGVTVPFIQSTFVDTGTRMQSDGFDPLELLGDEAFLSAMIGVIYLARRKAGEPISVADAAETPFTSFRMEDDDELVDVPLDGADLDV
jgi:hypothetical protein